MKLLGLALAYERSPSFNALLQAQGLAFKTIISKRSGRLTGLFSVSSSPRFLDEKLVQAAYLGDFRIENDLKIAAFWRKHYGLALSLFSTEPSLNSPQVFITAILKDNKLAHKTLVENPRGHGDFRYHFLRSVEMINILSRPLPFYKASYSGYRVRYVKADEEQKLIDFIDQHEQQKILGFDFKSNQSELWRQRIAFFPQFSTTRFLVVENEYGDWIATMLPSSPDSIKRMTLRSLAWPIKIFFSTLNTFGLRLPSEGESLKTLYLTHLNIQSRADTKKAIEAVLDFLRANGVSKNYHMISFANWWNHSWKDYLTYSAVINLYEVTSSNQNSQLTTESNLENRVFGFEMALV